MNSSRYPLLWTGAILALVLVALVLALADHAMTTGISSSGFRTMLDKETSKGLHMEANYGPFNRVGWLGMHTPGFNGSKGTKAIVSLDAHEVTGWFNPLGIGLRHWEVHAIHIQSGTVKIQKTNPTPGEPKGVKPIPWWALFWPYRVELEDVLCDSADVLFMLQNKESGIYHTRLEITPNGRDFEYDGQGGTFKIPIAPVLQLEHIHLLIRKPRLYVETFVLGDDPTRLGDQVQIHGEAGLQDDETIRATAKIISMQVSPWLPEKLRAHVTGSANGQLDYTSTGTGVATAQAHGSIAINDAVLRSLPIVKEYVTLTKSPDPGDLHLQVCQTDIRFDQGAISAENLKVECQGVFKLEGHVTMAKDKTLHGEMQLGLTDPYLRWLPTAKTAIFTQVDGAYHVTTVHFSGTAQKPIQDLSPRVTKELEKSPLLALKLFFRAA